MNMTNKNNDANNDVALKMSVRLREIAELLRGPSKLRAADVGCDHGYVSIYLVTHGIAKSCVAMDVRSGPLSGAKENVAEYGLSDIIETRLSDGLKELSPGEADALVIAGMGGATIASILKESTEIVASVKTFVLQPMNAADLLRRWLVRFLQVSRPLRSRLLRCAMP